MKRWKLATLIGGGLVGLALAGLVLAWWRNDWDLEAASMIGDAVAPLVGIMSMLALGVALWSARLQEIELGRHQEAYTAELRRERNARLKAVYAPFLSATSEYHEAVREYWQWMLSCNFAWDERQRKVAQAPCVEAKAALDRTRQAVILEDFDPERGRLRWQLGRNLRLEPFPDTVANQRLHGDILLYELSRRTNDFVALRESLHREFGEQPTGRDPKHAASDARSLAMLKEKADAARKHIDAQLDEQLREEYEARQGK